MKLRVRETQQKCRKWALGVKEWRKNETEQTVKWNGKKKCEPVGDKCLCITGGLGCLLTDCCVNCLLSVQLVKWWTTQMSRASQTRRKATNMAATGLAVTATVNHQSLICLMQVDLNSPQDVHKRLREGETIYKHWMNNKCRPRLQKVVFRCHMITSFGAELTTFTLAHIRWKAAHLRADTMSWNYTKGRKN